jgi:hypothetical protein
VVDPDTYELDGRDFRFVSRVLHPYYYVGRQAAISSRAGYEVLPKPIRAAVLLMVGDLYRFRETVSVGVSSTAVPMSTTVESLLSPYRVFG